jgi:RNA polymerase sigma-70 factor (ECF subfamily)
MKPQLVHPNHLCPVHIGTEDRPLGFDELFAKYAPYTAAVVLKLIGNESDVDDIVQEVFFDLSRNLNHIVDWEHARRWLVQVAVRKTRRLLRRRKLRALIHLPLCSTVDAPMPTASADDRAVLVQLFVVLKSLPVNHRIAWSLRFLAGAELTEVSEACGCSLATAKRWIRAAHQVIVGGTNA